MNYNNRKHKTQENYHAVNAAATKLLNNQISAQRLIAVGFMYCYTVKITVLGSVYENPR